MKKYSITTDQNGKGYLTITGEDGGKYDIEVNYAGNEKYNGCSANDTITITDDLPDEVGTQTGASVATTDDNNEHGISKKSNGTNPNNNTEPDIPGSFWYDAHYHVECRSVDSVVTWAEIGEGVGLTYDVWVDTYGWIYDGFTPIPDPYNGTVDNDTGDSQ